MLTQKEVGSLRELDARLDAVLFARARDEDSGLETAGKVGLGVAGVAAGGYAGHKLYQRWKSGQTQPGQPPLALTDSAAGGRTSTAGTFVNNPHSPRGAAAVAAPWSGSAPTASASPRPAPSPRPSAGGAPFALPWNGAEANAQQTASAVTRSGKVSGKIKSAGRRVLAGLGRVK